RLSGRIAINSTRINRVHIPSSEYHLVGLNWETDDEENPRFCGLGYGLRGDCMGHNWAGGGQSGLLGKVFRRPTAKSGVETDSTLEVVQNEDGIVVTRV